MSATLQRLNQGTLTLSSQIPFLDTLNGADRRASVADLATLVLEQQTAADGFVTQYASPAASGFTITIAPFLAGGNVFALITPLGAYAAGTIVLPSNPTDAQKVLVHCQNSVAALTVNGNGAIAVSGAPTSLAAGGFFQLRYDGVTRSWYRVG